jgi:hypothetical protein
VPSEPEESEKSTVPRIAKGDAYMNPPSTVTQNGRKYVPIQTISPVPLVNSNARDTKNKIIHPLC